MSKEKIKTLTDATHGQGRKTNVEPVSSQTLEDVATHDFYSYEFLLKPANTHTVKPTELSAFGEKYLDELEAVEGTSLEMLEYVASFLTTLESTIHAGFRDAIPTVHSYSSASEKYTPMANTDDLNVEASATSAINQLYLKQTSLLKPLLDQYAKDPGNFSDMIYTFYKKKSDSIHNGRPADRMVLAPGTEWTPSPSPGLDEVIDESPDQDQEPTDAPPEYPFELYPFNSVNFGIAITYRQRWKTLGIQRGEIVKTIPLGPGQTEKVSTKITRRKKKSRNMESSKESETSTETTDTTKDSSEIIGEASDSFKWNVNAEAAYDGIAFSGKVSAGMEGSQASSSKNTTSNLSEAMKKTASKMKSQSKVTVMTETESSYEMETSSEIHNPNDELALTYFYHTLQHQYEVFTYLAEVRSVVFVAERVPPPVEINASWVREHDWILVKALKDESFANILNELIQDEEEFDPIEGATNPYKDMQSSANDNFAKFTADGVGEGLGGLNVPDIYSEPQQQLDRYLREKAARKRANRLRDLRRNRLYKHIRQNILHYCRAIWVEEDNDQRLMRYRKEGRTANIQWQGDLFGVADPLEELTNLQPTGVTVPLQEVLDPTGPIGFTGNYIVFPLRPIKLDQNEGEENGNGPINVENVEGTLTVTLPLQEVLSQVMRAPYANDEGLHDPALELFVEESIKLIQRLEEKTGTDADALFFENPGDDLVRDFLSFMPAFTESLMEGDEIRRNGQGGLENPVSARDWGHYLHRKNATRRFLVDSNNLYIGIHVGEGTALEPFKHTHRYIDVLRAAEDLEADKQKNARRAAHTETPGEYDPDISKVVIAPSNVSDAAAGTASGEDD